MKNGNKILNIAKASRREEAKSAGYYDGRFRPRVVESKRHKKPKHKNNLIDN
jgi:hypothetical protein